MGYRQKPRARPGAGAHLDHKPGSATANRWEGAGPPLTAQPGEETAVAERSQMCSKSNQPPRRLRLRSLWTNPRRGQVRRTAPAWLDEGGRHQSPVRETAPA